MAKSPDRPHAPKGRDPAKHSRKDPAKPTRAKASRPDVPVLDPALADLLNPAIGQGRAGLGAQTGSPSPLVGEGGVGKATRTGNPSTPATALPTPTSISSPQGGGEERAAREQQ